MKVRNSILLLAISTACSFAAAFIGFGAVSADYTLSTRAYLALQLFTFSGGDVAGVVPLGLEIARWLAPATTLGGVYAAAHVFFARVWDGVRLRWIRGHTIICGGGTKGSALAAELAREPHGQVVLVDPALSTEFEWLRREGVVVLSGVGGDGVVMEQAGLARASRVVCISGNDRVNIGMALAVANSLPAERSLVSLEIHVHVAEVAVRNILQRSQLLDLKNDPRHRISLFNCHANRARLALEENPLEWDARRGLYDEIHLVVGELGQLEKALVVHAAQIGHFRHGGKVQVHLVSVRAHADEASLLKEYPGFRNCAGLHAAGINASDDFIERVAELEKGWGVDSLVTVIPSGGAQEALAEALLLGERLKDGPALRVLLDAPEDSGIRGLVEKNPQLAGWIRFLPDLLAAVGKEAVFQSGLDAVARRIHDTWKRGTDERIRKAEADGDEKTAAKHRAKDTYRGWDELTEEQKEGNRLAADHISVKFRAVNLATNAGAALQEAWGALDAAQLDMLCRMEHERWAVPLWMAGWVAGERDDALRKHPNLVPYDELDEGTRNYDLEQVRMSAAY